MCGSVGLMVDWWVVIGVLVCPIVAAFIPVVMVSALEPPKAEVHGLGLLRDNMVRLVVLTAVRLSVWMGVHG